MALYAWGTSTKGFDEHKLNGHASFSLYKYIEGLCCLSKNKENISLILLG